MEGRRTWVVGAISGDFLVFLGFLSRGEARVGGDAGEREGEERGREGDAGRDATGSAFSAFSGFLSGN